ncbi:MAG: hypothetical protein COA83_05015 [Methylophaga sp.]|nr:MAG: hypothetical protein COA83_05015 [Methylophaga sp.]
MSKLIVTVCLALFSFNCVAQQLADPTMPATYSPAKSVSTVESAQHIVVNTDTKLILNSTIVASNHKVAIINGVQYKVGDKVSDGSIVQSITHQQVKLLQQDSDVIILSLQKSFISHMKSTNSDFTN